MQSEEKIWNVVFFEENENVYNYIRTLLEDFKDHMFQMRWAQHGASMVEQICSKQYDVVLVDFRGDADGALKLLKEIHGKCSSVPVVLMTEWHQPDVRDQVVEEGPYALIQKRGLTGLTLGEVMDDVIARSQGVEP